MALEAYPIPAVTDRSAHRKAQLHAQIAKFLTSGASNQLSVQEKCLLWWYAHDANATTLSSGADLATLTGLGMAKHTVINGQENLHRLGVVTLARGHRGRPRRSRQGGPRANQVTFRLGAPWGPGCGGEPPERGGVSKRVHKGFPPAAKRVHKGFPPAVAATRVQTNSKRCISELRYTGTASSLHTEVTKVHLGQQTPAADLSILAETKTRNPADWLNEHLGRGGGTMPYDPAHPRKDWHRLVNVHAAAATAGYTRGDVSVAMTTLRVLTCPFDGEPDDFAVKLR